MSTQRRMKNAINDLFAKVIDVPELAESLRKYLVNRDLAIEIDGQRFQITKRSPTDEEKELELLRAQRINLKRAMKELINAIECDKNAGFLLGEAKKAQQVLVDN